ELAMTLCHWGHLAQIQHSFFASNAGPVPHCACWNLRDRRNLCIMGLKRGGGQLNKTVAIQEWYPIGRVMAPHKVYLLFGAVLQLFTDVENRLACLHRHATTQLKGASIGRN